MLRKGYESNPLKSDKTDLEMIYHKKLFMKKHSEFSMCNQKRLHDILFITRFLNR